MSTYEEDWQEEDRLFARLIFDDICEIRPNENLRIEKVCGVFTTWCHTGGAWKCIGISKQACLALDELVVYLGITEEEIEANLERR